MEDTRKLLLRFRRGVKGLILRRFVKLVWRSRPPFRRVDYMMKYEPPESCISSETLKVTDGPAFEEWLRRIRSESSPWTLHGGAEKSGESKHYKSMEEWPTLQEAMRTPISVPPPTFPGVSIPDIMICVDTVNIGIAQGYGTAYKLLKEQLNLETSSSQKSEIPDVSIRERDDFILKLPVSVSSISDHDGYTLMLPVQGSTRMGTPHQGGYEKMKEMSLPRIPVSTAKVTSAAMEEESEGSLWTLHGGESKHYKSMEEWPTLQEAMQQYDFQNHGFHCTSQTFPGVSIDDIITINIGTVNIRIPRA